MKKTAYSLLTVTVLAGTFLAPISSFAAVVNSATSNGKVIFEAKEGPTDPVDPTDPTQPIDPTNPGIGGGLLTIDNASHFDFDTQDISTKTETYFAKPDTYTNKETKEKVTGPTSIQVTDKRGTFAGWTLKVAQGEQFKTGDGTNALDKLTGARITFTNTNETSTTDKSYAPTPTASINLTPADEDEEAGAAQVVATAPQNKGMGTWITYFGESSGNSTNTAAETTEADYKSVKLEVPGATPKKAAEYKTTLSWTLEDVPAP